jgi:hypothetical protein
MGTGRCPVFPAPSISDEGDLMENSDACRRENAFLRLPRSRWRTEKAAAAAGLADHLPLKQAGKTEFWNGRSLAPAGKGPGKPHHIEKGFREGGCKFGAGAA